VETDAVLLYRVLPDGIAGDRLYDCPRLDEELLLQNSKSPQSRGSEKKRQRELDDELGRDNHKHTRTIGLDAEHIVVIPESHASVSACKAQIQPRWAKPSQKNQMMVTTSSNAIEGSHEPIWASGASHASDAQIKTRPLANNAASAWGERLFPRSFYALDVIDGFECMDILMAQRQPRIFQQAAFEEVFGLTWVRSTYAKHRDIYDYNRDLVPKY